MRRLDAIDRLDLIAVVGLALLATGIGLVSVPAALAVVGAALLVYAILASRSEVPK
jgi:hypothetical protein